MTQHLIPFAPHTFDEVYAYQHPLRERTRPGQALGVYITLHPQALEDLVPQIEGWFRGWPHVCIIDVGTSDKQGLGFLLMEWMECEVDPLFLAILRDDEAVGDYTVYARNL